MAEFLSPYCSVDGLHQVFLRSRIVAQVPAHKVARWCIHWETMIGTLILDLLTRGRPLREAVEHQYADALWVQYAGNVCRPLLGKRAEAVATVQQNDEWHRTFRVLRRVYEGVQFAVLLNFVELFRRAILEVLREARI